MGWICRKYLTGNGATPNENFKFAGVERLQPAKQTYVVWVVTDQEMTKNIGRVKRSNNLKVSFETVSSYKPIQIFITAEDDESAQYPGEQIVISTEKFWSNR